MNRRDLIKSTGLAIAGTALLPVSSFAQTLTTEPVRLGNSNPTQLLSGKRKLGRTLEVSSIGLGVQNMSRTYQTTIPSRPEMLKIIRTAFDNGVTLFDAAEAYGPHEVERILGEGVAPFRDKIVIETKFGWNIDQETGKRNPGLNSKPEHIKIVV
jgi:aryl-alcohol dehydrogenase-like predicted oxidoreductase